MVKRAVFLDRDGVINRPIVRDGKPYPPLDVRDFELLPGVVEACQRLKKAGFHIIVVTNQPDVARGAAAREEIEAMHQKMCAELPIDRVEVCYETEDDSKFRKPNPGMLLRAAAALDLDLKCSFMVGDRWRDVDCGYAAGCCTIFIDHGYAEPLRKAPHFRTHDLLSATQIIANVAASTQTS